jgi:hypothetical protein
MKAKLINERINWKGEWVNDEHPLSKVSEYSLKQDLIKELSDVIKKYHGRLKNENISNALDYLLRKYNR